MPEDVVRFTVLLEDIQTQVRAIADGHAGLAERMDRMDARLGRLESKVDHLEITVGVLSTRFEGFAGETKLRLERIETHLALEGPRQQRRVARSAPPRRRKKTMTPS